MGIKIPSDYYAPSPLTAAMGVTGLSSLVGGFYKGLCNANGTAVDPALEKGLFYGPIIASVPLAHTLYKRMVSDERILAQMPPVPEGAEGCVTVMGSVFSAGFVALIHGAGYAAGNFIGNAA